MSQYYTELREQIYSPIKKEGIFTWDYMNGAEYALATTHSPSVHFIDELQDATQRIGKIFTRVANVLRFASDDLLKDLGFPKATRIAARLPIDLENVTSIGRFDFAMTKKGLKLLEFNSDTPTGVVEAFYVNQKVADFFGLENPNQGCEKHLKTAFQHLAQLYQEKGYTIKNVFFTALGWHQEDRGTTVYLMQQSGFPNARFVPLNRLVVGKDRVFARLDKEEKIPIDLLYRLHPLEFLAVNKDKKGFPLGEHMLKLIALKKIAIVNQPAAFLTQSKAVQALIWNLHEQREFFSEEEHDVIETYFLPTYFTNAFQGIMPFVCKPFFGREGGGVSLFDQHGQLEFTDRKKQYTDQPMVYQERVDLQTIEVPTLKGSFSGRLLWGSFLIGGQPSAVLARIDQEITGDMAYFLPLGYSDAKTKIN